MNNICSVFEGTLIKCKPLWCILEDEVLAAVGVLFFEMSRIILIFYHDT
jgi:hypothetical protein